LLFDGKIDRHPDAAPADRRYRRAKVGSEGSKPESLHPAFRGQAVFLPCFKDVMPIGSIRLCS
jgi:hypothetical protein